MTGSRNTTRKQYVFDPVDLFVCRVSEIFGWTFRFSHAFGVQHRDCLVRQTQRDISLGVNHVGHCCCSTTFSARTPIPKWWCSCEFRQFGRTTSSLTLVTFVRDPGSMAATTAQSPMQSDQEKTETSTVAKSWRPLKHTAMQPRRVPTFFCRSFLPRW